jgi:hypothetical protein
VYIYDVYARERERFEIPCLNVITRAVILAKRGFISSVVQ